MYMLTYVHISICNLVEYLLYNIYIYIDANLITVHARCLKIEFNILFPDGDIVKNSQNVKQIRNNQLKIGTH